VLTARHPPRSVSSTNDLCHKHPPWRREWCSLAAIGTPCGARERRTGLSRWKSSPCGGRLLIGDGGQAVSTVMHERRDACRTLRRSMVNERLESCKERTSPHETTTPHSRQGVGCCFVICPVTSPAMAAPLERGAGPTRRAHDELATNPSRTARSRRGIENARPVVDALGLGLRALARLAL
jgi:hypothetical protein